MNSERNIVTETKADSLNSYHLQSAILTKKLAKLINKNRKQLWPVLHWSDTHEILRK